MGKRGVYIYGLDVLSKKLKDNVELDSVKKIVKTNVNNLNREAQINAPVDTGNLERSIDLSLDLTGLAGRVRANAEYAGYVGFGTRFMSAQPFMYLAFQDVKKQFRRDLKRLVE